MRYKKCFLDFMKTIKYVDYRLILPKKGLFTKHNNDYLVLL